MIVELVGCFDYGVCCGEVWVVVDNVGVVVVEGFGLLYDVEGVFDVELCVDYYEWFEVCVEL